MFSTVDICAVDLYTGVCNFLKAGAASTFIKRDHWVESITSESLAAGLVQQIDFETASRKLYHGDYLIMMTDGVLGRPSCAEGRGDHERDHHGCPRRFTEGFRTGNPGESPGIQ